MSRACLTANQMSFIDNLLGRAICGMTASAGRPLPAPSIATPSAQKEGGETIGIVNCSI